MRRENVKYLQYSDVSSISFTLPSHLSPFPFSFHNLSILLHLPFQFLLHQMCFPLLPFHLHFLSLSINVPPRTYSYLHVSLLLLFSRLSLYLITFLVQPSSVIPHPNISQLYLPLIYYFKIPLFNLAFLRSLRQLNPCLSVSVFVYFCWLSV